MRTFISVLIAMTFAFPLLAADYSFRTNTHKGIKFGIIDLTGDIVSGDYDEFKATFDWVRSRVDVVFGLNLNSNGGVVNEAVKIGTHVRLNGMATGIAFEGECYSSCALIFLSGLNRGKHSITKGKLGVHRSYFSNADQMNFKQLEQSLGKSHENISNYLRKMRVSETVIDDFLSTSSAEIKLLDDMPNDRLYDEFIISRCGAEPQRPVFPKVPTNTPPLKALEIFDKQDLETEKYFKRKEQWRDCSVDANIELLKDLQKKK